MKISIQIEFDKIMDVEISKSSVLIGRTNQNDVEIAHDSISRTHCKVTFSNGVFTMTDLGSSNGTFIDGQRLTPHKPMSFLSSAQIKIGKLDCEISNGSRSTEQIEKIETNKAAINSNATTTIRLSRIDLNKPSITLDLEKKGKQLKGPRNPITDGIQSRGRDHARESKKFWIVLLLAIAAIVFFLISFAKN